MSNEHTDAAPVRQQPLRCVEQQQLDAGEALPLGAAFYRGLGDAGAVTMTLRSWRRSDELETQG